MSFANFFGRVPRDVSEHCTALIRELEKEHPSAASAIAVGNQSVSSSACVDLMAVLAMLLFKGVPRSTPGAVVSAFAEAFLEEGTPPYLVLDKAKFLKYLENWADFYVKLNEATRLRFFEKIAVIVSMFENSSSIVGLTLKELFLNVRRRLALKELLVLLASLDGESFKMILDGQDCSLSGIRFDHSVSEELMLSQGVVAKADMTYVGDDGRSVVETTSTVINVSCDPRQSQPRLRFTMSNANDQHDEKAQVRSALPSLFMALSLSQLHHQVELLHTMPQSAFDEALAAVAAKLRLDLAEALRRVTIGSAVLESLVFAEKRRGCQSLDHSQSAIGEIIAVC